MKKREIVKKIAVVGMAIGLGLGTGETWIRPMQIYAQENVTVREVSSVLYSIKDATVYSYPDVNSQVITRLQEGLPVKVVGVTSNGWFQVDINGKYYIPGGGLIDKGVAASANAPIYDTNAIVELIKGTFSFYDNMKLISFTEEDVADMDATTYIKYLDSYIKGNATIDYCIMKDSGKRIREDYQIKCKTDASLANKTTQQYLIEYRNQYVKKSVEGPFRTKKDLILGLNRSIRYEIKDFTANYKNASIGSDEKRMEELLQSVLETMKEEQGVTFTYEKTYGTYKTEDGKTANGWKIVFSQK